MNYYNEFDPRAAAWIRQLIADKLIHDGVVDTRSIAEVQPSDLAGFTQCHFFAGVAGWSLALQLADWSSDRPIWTGSCPCQPFSAAGAQLGFSDERHLWPHFFRLINVCRPPVIAGEQVSSKIALEWLDGVCADLEGADYACAAADLCAAGVGAPHIRQRLYWVAYANGERRSGFDPLLRQEASGRVGVAEISETAGSGAASGLADAPSGGQRIDRGASRDAGHIDQCGSVVGLGDADSPTGKRFGLLGVPMESEQETGRPGNANAWSGFEVVRCADGKARRFEPGSFPLAHGFPSRVGLLRGYGNAIVPQVAARFIQAAQEARDLGPGRLTAVTDIED